MSSLPAVGDSETREFRRIPKRSIGATVSYGGQTMYSHLYEMLRARAERFPSAVALGSQQGLVWQTVTSRELLDCVDALAEALAKRGVSPSDRVVVWLPSSWWTPAYYFAIWKLGAIVVPFDREMNSDSARQVIKAVEPRAII